MVDWASWAVAAGTLTLAGVSWWQGKQLRNEHRAERARELAEKIYEPMLRDIEEWLNPADQWLGGSPFGHRGNGGHEYIWKELKQHSPHLTRRVPEPIRNLLERAKPNFQRLDDNWPKLRTKLRTRRDEVASQEAGADSGWSHVRFSAKIGENQLDEVRLTPIVVRDESMGAWLEREEIDSPHQGQASVHLVVSGETFSHDETLRLAKEIVEPIQKTDLYEQVREDYKELRRLGEEAKARIEAELDNEWS